MKNKVVIWGTNAENEKVLIALELKADDNKVLLYTFPEAIATDEFVNKMMNDWRDGKDIEFPEGYTTLERELSVTGNLLPDDLKVERGDLIQRAQTEWHFAVLSTKLHAAYQQELAEFKEKIEALSDYDNKIWDSLKAFWDKVQGQSRERNLFREHADNLRDNINLLFEDLKKMRSRVKGEFVAASQAIADEFNKSLDDIEARVAAGSSRIGSIFEELKQLQRRYRDARLSNEHRSQIWDRIDKAFKKAKERKFGPSANEGSIADRQERRLGGLLDAIKRMESSVRRDEDELKFQRKKVNSSEGQLEAQIRTAKIKMIEERLASKREKLAEMEKTRSEVEKQSNAAREKEARRAEKEAERQKIEAAKEAVKSEIAAEIKAKSGSTGSHEKEDSLFEAAATVIGDVLMNALDTAKAVATVAADKAEEAFEKAKDKAEETYDKAKDKAEEAYEKAVDKAEEVLESVKKTDRPKEGIITDDVVQNAGAGLESVKDSGDKSKTGIVVDDVIQKVEEGFEKAVATADTIVDDVVHKTEEVLEKFTAKADTIVDDVVQKAGDVLESLKPDKKQKAVKTAAEPSAKAKAEEKPDKPKRTTKKKEA